ncbi:MAG: hypothetical protein DWQ34_10410 [Planctomycetota bacterium]|nr:MAG: hypothetical protein DWQ34_10410 [Planctomycetota bacterium]REK21449.1 MAG: hypothetical protein DWQ41_21705 [Planctomycetota bacterium]REK40039.1 MAG: hypothetical protein DWQ45_00340 [Planctomycetota bacterium]
MQRRAGPQGSLGNICSLVRSALRSKGETSLCRSRQFVRGCGRLRLRPAEERRKGSPFLPIQSSHHAGLWPVW